LQKIAPIAVHYSTPYCHFQNNAENYIKAFKKNFLKVLNDTENPQARTNWALLLPTVTQTVNRQVIQAQNLTRESIHFNTPNLFYPLAEFSVQDNEEFNKLFDSSHPDVYNFMKKEREKLLSYKKRTKVPHYYPNQIVFVVDKTPSTAGTSSILKNPTKGPYKILSVSERNVTLENIRSKQTIQSHVDLLRPLNTSEFKLLISKNWDPNSLVKEPSAGKMYDLRSKSDRNKEPANLLDTGQDPNIDFIFDTSPSDPVAIQMTPSENNDDIMRESSLAPFPTESSQSMPEDEFSPVDFNSHQAELDSSSRYRTKLTGSTGIKKISFSKTIKNIFRK
jgi:hypothetical protein